MYIHWPEMITKLTHICSDAIRLAKDYFHQGHDLSYLNNISEKDFIRWYEEKQGKKFDRSAFDPDETAPFYEKSKFYSQKVCSFLNHNRNKQLISAVYDLFQSMIDS